MDKIEDRFYSIPYITEKRLNTIDTSDYIYIEEKLDGSNALFNIDEQGVLRVYGRNYELNDTVRALNGCYAWVTRDIGKDRIQRVIGTKYTVYFEWLAKKKHMEYPDSAYKKGYIFSVKDNDSKEYLSQDKVYEIAKELGIDTVPLLYEGQFISWEHAMKFIGQSKVGQSGEGIVIKAQGNKRGIQSAAGQRMIKLVAEEFKESIKCKGGTDFDKLDERQKKIELTKSVVTNARIEKAVYRIAEKNNINKLDKDSLTAVKKPIIGEVYRDCIKEEGELVNQIGKVFGAIVSTLVQEWINQSNM